MKEIQKQLASPSISPPIDLGNTISQIRKLVEQDKHFTEIIKIPGISLKLFELATTEIFSYSETEIKHEMQQSQLDSENVLKLELKDFSNKISQVRGLILAGRHPFAIQKQLQVSFQFIELVGREQLALDEMQAKLRDKRSIHDPDFTGLPFSELEQRVKAIRQGFQAHKSIGQIMSETKSTIRLVELALQQPELKLSVIEQEIRIPASDPDYNGMSYNAIRSLVRNIREANYEQPLPIPIPPAITPPPPRRPSMPELKPVELKVISTPMLRHWEYSSTIRMDQTFDESRKLAASLTSTRLFEAVELETHFKQMTKNNREPEALELYLFFKPLFESVTVDSQCKALLLLHRKQEKRIRQLILTILQGVLKPHRDRAIARLMDDNYLNFIESLEAQLNSKEKNNKKVRDFILAHYTIFEKHHKKLSLTQYGFKKLIVIFQLFKTKLDELESNSIGIRDSRIKTYTSSCT